MNGRVDSSMVDHGNRAARNRVVRNSEFVRGITVPIEERAWATLAAGIQTIVGGNITDDDGAVREGA